MAATLDAARPRGAATARTAAPEVESACASSRGRRLRGERGARPRSAADDERTRPQYLADRERRGQSGRVRKDLRHVLHVLRLLAVGDLKKQAVATAPESTDRNAYAGATERRRQQRAAVDLGENRTRIDPRAAVHG